MENKSIQAEYVCEGSELCTSEQRTKWHQLWVAAWRHRSVRAPRCPSHPSPTLQQPEVTRCDPNHKEVTPNAGPQSWSPLLKDKSSRCAGTPRFSTELVWCISLGRRGNLTRAGRRQTRPFSLGVRGQPEEIRTDRDQANDTTLSQPHQPLTAKREKRCRNANMQRLKTGSW